MLYLLSGITSKSLWLSGHRVWLAWERTRVRTPPLSLTPRLVDNVVNRGAKQYYKKGEITIWQEASRLPYELGCAFNPV